MPPDLKGKYVLLINPPWELPDATATIIRGAVGKRCYPPLGLAMLASYLEECGARVRIIDMQAQNTPLVRRVLGWPDFVGITANTPSIEGAYFVAREVKGIRSGAKVVLGGVHPTARPEEVLENPCVDYVIRGEGEKSLAQLIRGECYLYDVPGLACIRHGQYKEHPQTAHVENLDEMPMPAYDLLPMHLYNPPLGGALRTPSISMFSSRGCPGRCTYCNPATGKKLRFRSPEKIVEEIRYLIKNYGIREVTFYDDTFCANEQRVWDFCSQLIGQNLDITWSCFSRIDYGNYLLLRAMKLAGCHIICYGVESADRTILKNIKKNLDVGKVIPVTKMTQDAGIRVRLSFMLGNPGETRETMERTVRLAIKADPDHAQFLITTPFPGTEMYEWAEQRGYITTRDWSKYDFFTVVMKLPTVTVEDIQRYAKAAYRRFYLRYGFVRRFVISLFRYPSLVITMTEQRRALCAISAAIVGILVAAVIITIYLWLQNV